MKENDAITNENAKAKEVESSLLSDEQIDDYKVETIPKPDSNKKMESNGLTIKGHGQIEKFGLPSGWVEKPADKTDGNVLSSSRGFSPKDDPGCNLVLFYRGIENTAASANNFREILADPPHELNAEEIDSLGQTLGNMANPEAFEMRNIRTEKLDGKSVLVIDGEWKKSQKQFHGLMIDAIGNGTVIQEIFLETSAKSYAERINEVSESISKIRWKK